MSVVLPSEAATNGRNILWKGNFSKKKKLTESLVTHFDVQEH